MRVKIISAAMLLGAILTGFYIASTTHYLMEKGQPIYTQTIGFVSYLVGVIGRPLVARFFRLTDDFWNASLEVKGIQGEVKIERDKNGIPYVSATNQNDLCFGQGFTQVAVRPFQMELMRLLASGNCAAVLGGIMEDTDAITRTIISEETLLWKLRRLPPNRRQCLQAYADGATAAFQALPSMPVEFVLLGHSPKIPYSLMDVAAVSTLISIMLNRGLTGDYVRANLKENLGNKWKLFDFGFPEGIPTLNPEGKDEPSLYDLEGKALPLHEAAVGDDTWASRRPGNFPEATEPPLSSTPELGGGIHTRDSNPWIDEARMQKFHAEMKHEEQIDDERYPKPWKSLKASAGNSLGIKIDGSNAWAISGRFTNTGKPLLAGDPHLEVTSPGFWLPMGMSSDGSIDGIKVKAIGAAAVGVTGLFVGHNEFAAWTQTVAHTDIEDLYIVQLDDDGRNYFYDGKKYPLKFIEHSILVKGRSEPLLHLSRYSHHGPLISDAVPQLRQNMKPNQAIVMASMALRSPLPVEWAAKMLYGQKWGDYVEMGQWAQMSEFVTVWATVDGAIGASIGGAIPIRPPSPDGGLRNGSDSKQDWQGLLPTRKIPLVLNPPSGIIVAANCKLSKDDERVFGEVYVPGHRVLRAHQMLAEFIPKKKLELSDLAKMQEDQHSIHGCDFKEFVLKELNFLQKQKINQAVAANQEVAACEGEGLQETSQLLLGILEKWNCSMDSSSVGGTIYEVWLQFLIQRTFKENGWNNRALFSLLGGWLHPIWLPRTEALNHWRINLIKSFKSKESGVLPTTTSVRKILCKTADETAKYLSGRFGSKVEKWNWGLLRKRYIDHMFTKGAPLLRHLLGVGPLSWGGNFGTLKAHHFEPHLLRAADPSSGNFSQGLDTTSLRVLFDVSDWAKSRWEFFPGASGWVGDVNYSDTASALEDGKERLQPIPWNNEEIEASIVTRMRLIPTGALHHTRKSEMEA